MKFVDMVRFSIGNLSQRGLRSWLTILGIVIGVAAVVSILSIGAGMQQTISAQLGGLGSDVGYILPGFERAARTPMGGVVASRLVGRTITLTDKDFHTVKFTPGISYSKRCCCGQS
jgi:putative ABC transport system permease protein